MTSTLFCASHSPLMYCYARKPDRYDDIEKVMKERCEALKDFDPELVIIFGADHYNGFHLSLMPAFCVGGRAEAVGDIGGFAGTLDTPEETAMDMVRFMRQCDVDPAYSYDMKVDHGFSQMLVRAFDALDAKSTIPVFINGMAPPYVPFRRTRMMGEAIGKFAATLDKRIAFLASGGMSHNPRRYYPDFGSAEEDVTYWQLSGGRDEKSLTADEWIDRLEVMHHEGAHMLVDGRRTIKDIMVNPEFDQSFLDQITSTTPETIDAIDIAEMISIAGVGSPELHTWVAACAAHRAAGGGAPTVDIYAEALEYGIAFGAIHG